MEVKVVIKHDNQTGALADIFHEARLAFVSLYRFLLQVDGSLPFAPFGGLREQNSLRWAP